MLKLLMLNVGYFDGPKATLRSMDCGGKGAAADTALDFPERQKILERWSIQSSGVIGPH